MAVAALASQVSVCRSGWPGEPDLATETSALTTLCGAPNNCYYAGAGYTVTRYDAVLGQNVSYPPHAYQSREANDSACWAACGSTTQNQKNHTGCTIVDPGPNPGNNFYAQCGVSD